MIFDDIWFFAAHIYGDYFSKQHVRHANIQKLSQSQSSQHHSRVCNETKITFTRRTKTEMTSASSWRLSFSPSLSPQRRCHRCSRWWSWCPMCPCIPWWPWWCGCCGWCCKIFNGASSQHTTSATKTLCIAYNERAKQRHLNSESVKRIFSFGWCFCRNIWSESQKPLNLFKTNFYSHLGKRSGWVHAAHVF